METRLEDLVELFVPRTLAFLGREYPNGVVLHLTDDTDLRPPRELFPAFHGCYDWHSSVHSHWQLVRVLRRVPDSAHAGAISATIDVSLAEDRLAGELATLERAAWFELPYGMGWLLQLCAELREWDDPAARRWGSELASLERLAVDRLTAWCDRLPAPVRSGVHGQSAFAAGLVFDWAVAAGRDDARELVAGAARRWYLADRRAPLAYEPSAGDFLSPSLAEADLMRRVLSPTDFAGWIDGFFPAGDPSPAGMLVPLPLVDPADGRLAHVAGLVPSRAWMAEGIVSALPGGHRLREPLLEVAASHRAAAVEPALHPDYMVSHWAPTFLVYLLTGRGLGQRRPGAPE
ncbi:MAG: DUF2891 domain-containing protein [Acidimicrobiia bacterium]